MILAGDIGGTKSNIALFEPHMQGMVTWKKAQYISGDYGALEEVIDAFVPQNVSITGACFGVAGPVVDGGCRTTNLPWEVTLASLRRRLQTDHVHLLNDLEAMAYGMLYVDDAALVDVNPTGTAQQGNCAVIAAGTGLGEGMLYWDGREFHPIASEGGHCDFAPVTSQQDALLVWLRERYPDHVSYERILSGPGVYTLYEFLLETGYAPAPLRLQTLPPHTDKSVAVSQCALEDGDPLCQEALRLFVEIYGAEAGNLALKSMALGGVYIGGGIAPKILPEMQGGGFLKAFVQKGRFEEMLRHIPIQVCLDPETALIGASQYGFRRWLSLQNSHSI